MEEGIFGYITQIANATRRSPDLILGGSPRAAIATLLAGGTYWAIVVNFVTSYTTSTIVSYLLAPYRPALSLARFRDFAGFVGWLPLPEARIDVSGLWGAAEGYAITALESPRASITSCENGTLPSNLLNNQASVPEKMPSTEVTVSPVSTRSRKVEITGRPAPTVAS